MSKALSGLFLNTQGYTLEMLARWAEGEHAPRIERPLELTAIVWKHIEPTDECCLGTEVPRSFVFKTATGSFWVNPNGSKHVKEAVVSAKEFPRLKEFDPKLYAQFILYDYMKALEFVAPKVSQGHRLLAKSGNWEFAFGSRGGTSTPWYIMRGSWV